MLLCERGHPRHHRVYTPGALRAVGPKAALAPAHAGAHGPLGHMVGRLPPCMPHERPQGLPPLEDLPTWPFRLRDATGVSRFEPPLYRTSDGPHLAGETRLRQRPLADPRPPVTQLTHLGPQGFPHGLGWSATRTHGLDIPPQMRPAELSTPRGLPVVRTPALRDQPSPTALTQELPGHLPTARPPHDTPGDRGRDRRPQPGTRPPFAPSGFVQVRRRLLLDIAPCFRHGLGHRLRGRLLQARERTQTARHANEICPDALRGALGQMIGARAPRGDGLPPWAKLPAGHSHRPLGSRGLPPNWADQPLPLILGDARLHGWDLGDLLPLGLAIFSRPGVLTTGAARGLDGDDHRHPLDRDQRAGVPLVAGLPAGPTPTGLVPWAPAEGLRRIARRRPR